MSERAETKSFMSDVTTPRAGVCEHFEDGAGLIALSSASIDDRRAHRMHLDARAPGSLAGQALGGRCLGRARRRPV